MGRLIDANLLEEGIKKWLKPSKPDEDEYISIADALASTLQEIEEQPTAFDVDKVVESLKRDSYKEAADDMNPFEPPKVVNLSKAIEIVKGGGVDGN